MQVRQVDANDLATLAAISGLTHACNAVDSPWFNPWTTEEYRIVAERGWDGEPPVIWVGEEGGQVVACSDVWMSERDNLHLAWLKLQVHPEHRRKGLGSELFEHVAADVKVRGRTSIGADGWDADNANGFAAKHGLQAKSVGVCRQQILAELDGVALKAMMTEAADAASDYELVRMPARTTPDMIDDVVELVTSINDAPIDDLDIEDEVFTAERVWGYEDTQAALGRRLYRVVARHRESGVLGGNTVVAVRAPLPAEGLQHDTSVVRAHRGHRLGALLKLGMLEWLAEAEPQLEVIQTWNAESNDLMIGINEAMGYRVTGRAVEFQRDL